MLPAFIGVRDATANAVRSHDPVEAVAESWATSLAETFELVRVKLQLDEQILDP